MKNARTKGLTSIIWIVLRLIAFAAVVLVSVFGVLYELLDYPVWEKLVAKFGISDGIRFFWIVSACGVAVFLLSLWAERWDPRRRPKETDADPQGRKPQ